MDKRYYILIAAIILIIVFGILLIFQNQKPETATINFVTSSEQAKSFKDIIPTYEALNNVKVNIVELDKGNYELESLNRISTGKIDVWQIPYNWLPKHSDKLSPIGIDRVTYDSAYPKVIGDMVTINNQIYGYPLSVDALVLYQNSKAKSSVKKELTRQEEDILDKPVNTWENITDISKILTEKNGSNISLSGLALGTSSIPSATDILNLLMLQEGAQMTNSDHTQTTFHTAVNLFSGDAYPGAKALDFYSSFAKNTNTNYSYQESLGEVDRAFANNKIVYMIDYFSKQADLLRINPDLSYRVYDIPQLKETQNPVSWINFEALTLPNTDKNQEAAFNFINYLTDPEASKLYYEKSEKQPIINPSFEDADRVIRNAVENAGFWYNPDPIQVDQTFRAAINDVVIANKNPQTVLEGAAFRINNLLEAIR